MASGKRSSGPTAQRPAPAPTEKSAEEKVAAKRPARRRRREKPKGELQVTISGRFQAGSVVKLFERRSDRFVAGQIGSEVASAKTGDDSTTQFTGLPAGEFWAVLFGEDGRPERAVAVTAKARGPQPLASAAPGENTGKQVVTGARNSRSR